MIEMRRVEGMMDRVWMRGLSSRLWRRMGVEVGKALVDSHQRGASMYMTVPNVRADLDAFRRRGMEMATVAEAETGRRYGNVAAIHGDELTAILYLLFFDADPANVRPVRRGIPAAISRRAAFNDIPMAAARRAFEVITEDDVARDLALSFPSRSRLAARTEVRRALNVGIADAAISEGRDPSVADPMRPFVREVTYPLWEIREIMDRRTRGNPNGDFPEGSHWQVNGYISTMEEIVRQDCVPPCGWNCRAALVPVGFERARRLGLLRDDDRIDWEALRLYNQTRQPYIDNGLYPDRGFR